MKNYITLILCLCSLFLNSCKKTGSEPLSPTTEQITGNNGRTIVGGSGIPNATYGNNGDFYLDKATFFMPVKNHFLLALLNSKLIGFYLSSIVSKVRGGYFSLSKIYVEKVPIKNISLEQQKPFIELVDKIISKKHQDEDTKDHENQIDELVYQLYDITDDEKKLIEIK